MMLKLQYFGHLMQTANSLEKTLMLGKIEGRRRGQQMTRWLDGINGQEHGQTPGVGERQGSLACCSPWCHEKLDMIWQLKNTNKSHFLNLSIDLYSAFCLWYPFPLKTMHAHTRAHTHTTSVCMYFEIPTCHLICICCIWLYPILLWFSLPRFMCNNLIVDPWKKKIFPL